MRLNNRQGVSYPSLAEHKMCSTVGAWYTFVVETGPVRVAIQFLVVRKIYAVENEPASPDGLRDINPTHPTMTTPPRPFMPAPIAEPPEDFLQYQMDSLVSLSVIYTVM